MTTLGDLAAGAEMVVNGVTYSNFEVAVKGSGLSADLDDYAVMAAPGGGFTVELADGEKPGKSGKLTLDYDASGSALVSAMLSVAGVEGAKIKASQKLRDQKTVGKLSAKTKSGGELDTTDLPSLASVGVKSQIKAKGGGSVTAAAAGAIVVPEPATGGLVAVGLLGLALTARRRSA